MDLSRYPLLAALVAKYGADDPGRAQSVALHQATLGIEGAARDRGTLELAMSNPAAAEKELQVQAQHVARDNRPKHMRGDGSAIPKP